MFSAVAASAAASSSLPSAPVRQGHPFIDLSGLVSRLLDAVLPKRSLQRLNCLRILFAAHQNRATRVRRPCAKARGAERFSTGFQFSAMSFGFVKAAPRQRHLDGAA